MGKIIISEHQFNLLLKERDLSDFAKLKGTTLHKIGGIPIDKQETPYVINDILTSEELNPYTFPNSVDLTTLSTRNKIRFDTYWDTFHKARKYGRGDMWEGLFAGLFGGVLPDSGSDDEEEYVTPRADVILEDGRRLSLKFLNGPSESPVLGNLGTAYEMAIAIPDLLPPDYQDASVTEIFQTNDPDLIDFKVTLLRYAFEDVDEWAFAYPEEKKLIVKYINTDNLTEKIVDNPQLINKPKSKGNRNQLRISSVMVSGFEGIGIIFPSVSQEEYDKFLMGTPREQVVSKIFGKYVDRMDPDTITYIRKNPSTIIKKFHDIYGEDLNLGLTF